MIERIELKCFSYSSTYKFSRVLMVLSLMHLVDQRRKSPIHVCDHWSLHWHGSRGSPANDKIEQIIFTVCLRFRHCSHSISSEFAPHFGHISALTFVCLTEICSDTLLPLFALLSFLCPMKTVHASDCIDTDPFQLEVD